MKMGKERKGESEGRRQERTRPRRGKEGRTGKGSTGREEGKGREVRRGKP